MAYTLGNGVRRVELIARLGVKPVSGAALSGVSWLPRSLCRYGKTPMKRVLLIVLPLLTLLFVAPPFLLGTPLWQLGNAVALATGLGAKLACSGRFISGFDDQRILDDLASYAGVNRRLSLDFTADRVRVSLFGLASTSATYRPGLGCTLDTGDTTRLDTLSVPSTATSPGMPLDVDIAHPAQQAAEALLRADNAEGLQTRALLVLQGNRLIAESYAPGFTADSRLLGWSMGKSLMAIVIGRMQALELIPGNVPGPLFPEWAHDDRARISLTQLLQMTSGLDWQEDYVPGSDSTRMLFHAPSASAVALASPPEGVPGERFYYSSGTTNLLARFAAERLGGPQAQLDFLQREVLQPLGMHGAMLEVDPAGIVVASSFVYATARDWVRLGRLLLDQGSVNGRPFLPPGWVARATRPNSSRNDPRYGYQLWLNGGGAELRWPGLPRNAFAMLGNRGQAVLVLPDQALVLVRLGWTAGDYPLAQKMGDLLSRL
jgi:hypothetical protein